MQQITLVKNSDKLEFKLSGEIDSANSDDFLAEVESVYKKDKKDIEFDCAALTFIDSTMLGTFVKILKTLKADGKKMSLFNVQPRIRKLFEICALDTIMEIRR